VCHNSFKTFLHLSKTWRRIERQRWMISFIMQLQCYVMWPFIVILLKIFINNKNFKYKYLFNKKTTRGCCFITNLTCDKLIMKFIWSLFIHRFIHFTYKIPCVQNTSDTQINVLMDEVWTYKWKNVTRISHFLINLCQMCFQFTISMCDMYKL
jgi:hypothetical protein